MSPAPAEHSVLAFQSKNFNVLVSTIAALMLSALHWSKSSPEISVCHMWGQAKLTFMKFEVSPFLQK